MLALKRHPLVRADLEAAFNWYEEQETGLGQEFGVDFRAAYRRLREGPLLYALRFADVRRLNLGRFNHGIFYVMRDDELRILAVLHGSRDHKSVLAERRRSFVL